MKQIAIVAFFAIFIGACNTITSPITIPPTPTMTATVNGGSWSTVGTLGTGSAKATRSSSSGVVTVTGVASDLTEITLVLNNPKTGTSQLVISGDVGEYSQGIPDTSTAYVTIPTLTNPLPGSVTITTFDTTKGEISGSFSFVARKSHNMSDTVRITNGSFSNVTWSK
jgi:hypothetical protein